MTFLIWVFIFTYCILVACATFFFIGYFFSKKRKTLFIELIAANKIQGLDEDAIENLIDERLNELIIGFKKMIPMIEMFLSQKKENELREFAKEELLKIVPCIKQKFSQGKGLLDEKIEQLVNRLWKHAYLRLLMASACLGAILGLLEAVLLVLLIKTI